MRNICPWGATHEYFCAYLSDSCPCSGGIWDCPVRSDPRSTGDASRDVHATRSLHCTLWGLCDHRGCLTCGDGYSLGRAQPAGSIIVRFYVSWLPPDRAALGYEPHDRSPARSPESGSVGG